MAESAPQCLWHQGHGSARTKSSQPSARAGWGKSIGRGIKPAWSRNGNELFFFDANNALTAISVQSASPFTAGRPTRILEARYFAGSLGVAAQTFDVARDGRFLLIKDESGSVQHPEEVMILHWDEELSARVGSDGKK